VEIENMAFVAATPTGGMERTHQQSGIAPVARKSMAVERNEPGLPGRTTATARTSRSKSSNSQLKGRVEHQQFRRLALEIHNQPGGY
jgi:hypothetical protein